MPGTLIYRWLENGFDIYLYRVVQQFHFQVSGQQEYIHVFTKKTRGRIRMFPVALFVASPKWDEHLQNREVNR